jgi:glucose-specific phosphotransferase system IIA component
VVEQIFETKHAILLCGDNNVKALIHIGLDTVNLKGEGFESFVKEGDTVKLGDLLIKADLNVIKANNYSPMTPIVIVNTEDYNEICTVNNNEMVIAGDKMLKVK